MFSKVNSGGLRGIEGYLVQVEADVSRGLPGFHMVGYLAGEVKEAEDRVRTALRNAGFALPAMKVTLNLSPADIRKEGSGFDLPIAIAVLASYGVVRRQSLTGIALIGELGLDGTVKPVRGILSMVLALEELGIRRCFLPAGNLEEGLVVQNMEICAAHNLQQVVGCLAAPGSVQVETGTKSQETEEIPVYSVDFKEINGQLLMRRATEIAVAGQHNILYMGPPGSGKSMVAQRVPTIMPSMTFQEQLEVTKVHSICGMLPPGRALVRSRPFRAPHHSISSVALVGGGRIPTPGEISMATRGVLFLDELPEFPKSTLELLRQPLEEHRIVISRAQGSYEFPAHFMIVVALNCCPCGYFPDRNRCSCTQVQVQKYLNRISGPLLDRLDICVEAAPVTYGEMRECADNEPSAVIRKRVEEARRIQRERFADTGIFSNSEMSIRDIRIYCRLEEEEERFLKQTYQKMQMSARGCNKILKVARTIADLDGAERIRCSHLSEALGYRELNGKYWGRR